MGKTSVKDVTEELVTPILKSLNLELVDIEYVKEGKNWFLRVYIDSPDGVDLDECSAVSEQLSEVLDEKDPIKQAYYLEVSSPGAERPLKNQSDIVQAVGKQVRLTTYEPIDGEKVFEGKLIQFENEILTVQTKVKTKTKDVNIPLAKVASARLAVAF